MREEERVREERELHLANILNGRNPLKARRTLHQHCLISNLSKSNLKLFICQERNSNEGQFDNY